MLKNQLSCVPCRAILHYLPCDLPRGPQALPRGDGAACHRSLGSPSRRRSGRRVRAGLKTLSSHWPPVPVHLQCTVGIASDSGRYNMRWQCSAIKRTTATACIVILMTKGIIAGQQMLADSKNGCSGPQEAAALSPGPSWSTIRWVPDRPHHHCGGRRGVRPRISRRCWIHFSIPYPLLYPRLTCGGDGRRGCPHQSPAPRPHCATPTRPLLLLEKRPQEPWTPLPLPLQPLPPPAPRPQECRPGLSSLQIPWIKSVNM